MGIYGNNFEYGDSFYKDEASGKNGEGWYNPDTTFTFLPNWLFPVKLSYEYNTVISATRRKYEQRKPLRSQLNPQRKHIFTVTEQAVGSERVWNYLISLHADSQAVPIFSEPCLPSGSGSLAGVSVVGVVNPIESYYNLRQLTEFVAVIDRLEEIDTEVIYLDSITAADREINLDAAIVGAFQREHTVLFPVFQAYLTGNNRDDITDSVANIRIEFTEFDT